jgi:hypothetical protein
MQWGSSVKSLLEIKKASGKTPLALLNRPLLRADCLDCKKAFHLLSGQRQSDQTGPQPIAISEIESYLRLKRIDDEDEIDTYLEAITALDALWLENVREKMAQAIKSPT